MANSTSVFLNVNNVEKTLAFYEALGFDVASRYEDDDGNLAYADLAFDGAELSVGAISANEDPDFQAWVAGPLGAGVLVVFSVDDVDQVFERAKAYGAEIESEPSDRPYGRGFEVVDPDGYSLAFLTEKAA